MKTRSRALAALALMLAGGSASPAAAQPLPIPHFAPVAADPGLDSVVALVWTEGPSWGVLCSGTVIHRDWVLTAAHCTGAMAHLRDSADYGFEVRVGVDAAHPDSVHPVESWTQHPAHLPDDLTADAALLRLASPTEVAPMTLVGADEDEDRFDVSVGYGGGGPVVALSSKAPRRSTPIRPGRVDATRVWHQAQDDHRLCPADSGGPVLRSEGGGWVQAAVQSFVASGCDRGLVASTRVEPLSDWIVSVTEGASEPAAAFYDELPSVLRTPFGIPTDGIMLPPSVAWLSSDVAAAFAWQVANDQSDRIAQDDVVPALESETASTVGSGADVDVDPRRRTLMTNATVDVERRSTRKPDVDP